VFAFGIFNPNIEQQWLIYCRFLNPNWQSQDQMEKRITAEDTEDPGEGKSFYQNQPKLRQG